jgi:hypothetical protein
MSDVTAEEFAERLSILTLREFTPPEMLSTVHTGWRFLVTPPRRERLRASDPRTRSDESPLPGVRAGLVEIPINCQAMVAIAV